MKILIGMSAIGDEFDKIIMQWESYINKSYVFEA